MIVWRRRPGGEWHLTTSESYRPRAWTWAADVQVAVATPDHPTREQVEASWGRYAGPEYPTGGPRR